ncbi:MAG: ROK family protein [Trebonia sp.]
MDSPLSSTLPNAMSLAPVVLGVDFGGTKIATAVCDLSGHRLATRVIDAEPGRGARSAFNRGVRSARELLAEASHGRPLAGVGVSTFGIPSEDGVALAPAIDGWEDIAMGRELREAFAGTPVTMATDVKAAALAEARWGALAGADPGVYLNLGTGLAAAIVIGGVVLSGANGAAGEIGYNLRQLADVGDAGYQMLEETVSGRALARLSGRPPAEAFAAGAGPRLAAIADQFTAELAFHVVNLAICIDPVRIAVGGGMTRSWDRIRPRLDAALTAAAPYRPELVLAGFPFDAPLVGALALAVDAITAAKTDDGVMHNPHSREGLTL